MRVLVILLLATTYPAWADVYKTVDKDGRVIYSDSPVSDKAEKIELRDINTVPRADPLPGSPVDSVTPQEAKVSYEIDIISPRTDVTIPAGQRDLAIAVSLNPPLQNDHLLVYFLNGELLEETTMSNIVVKDVPRGAHALVVEAIDADGQSLGTSTPVTVNVIRPIVKPAASPTPKAK